MLSSASIARAAALSVASLVAALPAASAQSPPPPLSIAVSGAPAPGFPAGAGFSTFQGPRLDGSGRSAFYGSATGGGVNAATDQGIFRQGPAGLTLLVREGQLAPGTQGAMFLNLAFGATNPPMLGLNTDGVLAFSTMLTGGDVCDCNHNGFLDNDTAMYRLVDGQPQLLARADGQVPGQVAGLKFDKMVGPPLIAENGTFVSFFVFKGTGVTFSNGTAIMVATDGPLAIAVRQGDPMPGFPAGTVLQTIGRPFIGPQGEFSFLAHLQGPGINLTNDDVLLAFTGGPLQLLAREGELLANGDVLGNPAVQSAFFNFSNVGGPRPAFCSLLADDGMAVLRVTDDGPVEVVRSGQAAPGLPLGTKFQGFGFFNENGPLQLNPNGQLVFMARLNTPTPSNESLWLADPDGTLHLVAQGGQTPPGAPAGVTFGNGTGGFVPLFGAPATEPGGRLAFSGNLAGPGLDLFSRGLYATDSAGVLHKIVQPGDVLDLKGNGSDLRTVDDVEFNKDAATFEAYNGPTFTEDGTLVFRVLFMDGTQAVFEEDLDGAFEDLGGGLAGVAGVPLLVGSGSLGPFTPGSLSLSQAAAGAPAALFIALGSSPAPFKGGTLLASPPLIVVSLATDGAGHFTLPFITPSALPATLDITFQVAVLDGAAVHGVAISNAVGATTP